MNKYQLPKLPLPLPLSGSQAGSFTEYTVTTRMPNIAHLVIQENNFSQVINHKLEQLSADLQSGYLQPLSNDNAIDFEDWQTYIKPYLNQRWLDIPWFVAETYFYRLILNLTNYFLPGEYQYLDPFLSQKQKSLETSIDSIIYLSSYLEKWLEEPQKQSNSSQLPLISALYFSLWGNRVDLSLWSASEDNRSNFDIQQQLNHILVDDSLAVMELLTQSQNNQIDIIVDNAGFELICDLCLVIFLLDSGFASQVNLHLKPHPTFVSDAMIKDVQYTQEFLSTANHDHVKSFSNRLSKNLAAGKLVLKEDYFWTSPLAFWQIHPSLKNELANSNLIIIKGDANYRRLLGDLHWDYTTNFTDIVTYLPAPMVALRTLKSEVAAGLKAEVIQELTTIDPKWLTNGQWGVIQLVNVDNS
ncbi:MAG: protein-glutamate O-methyltransferase family protein [Sphaerospermopsis sp. SIO1G1]|nr:protein-glutamate O-methyltransferase family protein [Sphaerospermopsis sp. SIO1G1]